MYPLLGEKILDEGENITTVDPYEDHDWMLPLATVFYVIGTFCCMLMIFILYRDNPRTWRKFWLSPDLDQSNDVFTDHHGNIF